MPPSDRAEFVTEFEGIFSLKIIKILSAKYYSSVIIRGTYEKKRPFFVEVGGCGCFRWLHVRSWFLPQVIRPSRKR